MYRKDTYKDCYRPIIYPTNGENIWEYTTYPNILPPPSRRAPERPKRRRNKDVYKKRKDTKTVSKKRLSNKCSVCDKSGITNPHAQLHQHQDNLNSPKHNQPNQHNSKHNQPNQQKSKHNQLQEFKLGYHQEEQNTQIHNIKHNQPQASN